MSRGRQIFKQMDVTKALKGAKNAGVRVKSFEVTRDGKIVIFTDSVDSPTSSGPRNEWDDVQ